MHQNVLFSLIKFQISGERAQPPPKTPLPLRRGHPLATTTPLDAFGVSPPSSEDRSTALFLLIIFSALRSVTRSAHDITSMIQKRLDKLKEIY